MDLFGGIRLPTGAVFQSAKACVHSKCSPGFSFLFSQEPYPLPAQFEWWTCALGQTKTGVRHSFFAPKPLFLGSVDGSCHYATKNRGKPSWVGWQLGATRWCQWCQRASGNLYLADGELRGRRWCLVVQQKKSYSIQRQGSLRIPLCLKREGFSFAVYATRIPPRHPYHMLLLVCRHKDSMFRFDYSTDFLQWALKPPGYLRPGKTCVKQIWWWCMAWAWNQWNYRT